MSDGSFPHPIPDPDSAPEAERTGARVLDFPADESESWESDAETSVDEPMLQSAL